MNIAYRTYLYTQESERIKLVPNGYFRSGSIKDQALTKYANQDIQLIEAQIVAGEDEVEVLRSIKVWYMTIDDQGHIERRTMSSYNSQEIKTIEQNALLENSDHLVQNYINGLFSEDDSSANSTEPSETITSRIWTIFRAVNSAMRSAQQSLH